MGRVIAVASQKGGVGKTTTTINLGACLAEVGRRVLIVDVDPQGNASSGLGINGNTQPVGVYEALIGSADPADALIPTAMEGLEIITSGQRLSGAEVELVGVIARETRLRGVIGALRDRYDFVLIDCPPSLGLLTVNALTAADSVLIPLQCEYLALEGLTQLIAAIRLVQDHLNSALRIEGVLLTMFDARLNLAQQVVDEARKFFSDRVYKTVIPRSVRLGEAPSFGKPIVLYDPHSTGAVRYRELALEVMGQAGVSRARGVAAEARGEQTEVAGAARPPGQPEGRAIPVAPPADADGADQPKEQAEVVVHADAMHAGVGDAEEHSDRPEGIGQEPASQPGAGGSDECTERPSVEVSRP
jgi:chromosome partitioning protein